MKTGVILLAAGSGQRFGHRSPKQFLPLMRVPLFVVSLREFLNVSTVKEIVVVAPKNKITAVCLLIEKHLKKGRGSVRVHVVAGGDYRGASVRCGVLALSDKLDVILVHDSARPLVTADIIRRVEKAAFKKGVALAAWPLPDTLKLSDGKSRARKTIPRKNLWLAQTPQGFKRAIALKCLLHPIPVATDDAELAERKGIPVSLVLGSPTNFKVTVPHDLKLCEALLHEK